MGIVKGHGDHLTVRFHAAATERFLVLNELYHPGWQAEAEAEAEGQPIKIHPTNIVMRGIIVPAGIDQISFHYTPLSASLTVKNIRVIAIILLFGIFLCLRTYCSRSQKVGVKNAAPQSI